MGTPSGSISNLFLYVIKATGFNNTVERLLYNAKDTHTIPFPSLIMKKRSFNFMNISMEYTYKNRFIYKIVKESFFRGFDGLKLMY